MHCLHRHRLLAGALALLAALAARPAAADIVYLQDGTNVRGTAVTENDHVIVTTDDGAVRRIPADQVVYIAVEAATVVDGDDPPDDTDDDDDPDPPTPEPVDDPPEPPPTPPTPPTIGAITPPDTVFAMGEVTLPDSIVYMLMRRVASGDTTNLYELHQDIDRWRAASHDRLRQVHGDWLRPGLFAQRRDRYSRELDVAVELAQELRGIRGDEEADDEKRAELNRKIDQQLLEAAGVWLDPTTKVFLQGAAHYRAGNYTDALAAFERAQQANPLVAAYHQAVGLCLIEIEDRQIDGLTALLSNVQLRPDSVAAVRRLHAALERVPGEYLRDPTFLRAREVLDTYPAEWFGEQRRQPPFAWQMPGPAWTSSHNTLPTPPYDRLITRQAIAIPIAEHKLLVDRSIVEGALEVIVRISDQTLVVADTPRSFRVRQGQTNALTAVTVPDYVFEPVTANIAAIFRDGDVVQTVGVNVTAEMGTAVRPFHTRLAAGPDGDLSPELLLAAGESTAPVVSVDGRLVGALTGRTDVLAAQGGDGAFIELVRVAELVRSHSSSRPRRRTARTTDPQPAPGRFFVVYGLFGEKLD